MRRARSGGGMGWWWWNGMWWVVGDLDGVDGRTDTDGPYSPSSHARTRTADFRAVRRSMRIFAQQNIGN
jgi:hypothetical protein